MSDELAIREAPADLEEVMELADTMVRSNFFTDASTAVKATVKILAGRELGLGPVESMRSFHIVENKVEFAAEFLAQRVRQHPHYSYKVLELENDRCVIAFYEDGEEIGRSKFDDADRERAELSLESDKGRATAWAKYPRNMLFARAMSNGVAWFAPDVVAGAPALIDIVRPEPEPDTDPASTIEVGGETAADTGSDEPGGSGEGGGKDDPAPSSDAAPKSSKRKATQAQLTKLMLLAQEHGWDDAERHRRAEVESFTDLTKQAASVLIEAWSVEEGPGRVSEEGGSEPGSDAGSAPSDPGLDPDAPPSAELMRRARQHIGTDSAIVVLARKFEPSVKNFDSLTAGQLATALEAYLRRKDCMHPMVQREDSGFCRRCGQMVEVSA